MRRSLPDERSVHDRGDDTDRDSPLLGCLTTGGTAPSENERVDTVGTNGEDDHGDVAASDTNVGAG